MSKGQLYFIYNEPETVTYDAGSLFQQIKEVAEMGFSRNLKAMVSDLDKLIKLRPSVDNSLFHPAYFSLLNQLNNKLKLQNRDIDTKPIRQAQALYRHYQHQDKSAQEKKYPELEMIDAESTLIQHVIRRIDTLQNEVNRLCDEQLTAQASQLLQQAQQDEKNANIFVKKINDKILKLTSFEEENKVLAGIDAIEIDLKNIKDYQENIKTLSKQMKINSKQHPNTAGLKNKDIELDKIVKNIESLTSGAEGSLRNMRQQQEEAKLRKQLEEETLRKQLEEETLRKQLEEETLRKQLEEETLRKQLEEETLRKQLEEETLRKQLEEETLRKQLEEETLRKQLEEETLRKQLEEETLRKQLEEETLRKQLEAETLRKQLEEETLRKQLEAETLRKQLEAETLRKQLEEETLRKQLEAETLRKQLEEETLRKQLEEEKLRKHLEEETQLCKELKTERLQAAISLVTDYKQLLIDEKKGLGYKFKFFHHSRHNAKLAYSSALLAELKNVTVTDQSDLPNLIQAAHNKAFIQTGSKSVITAGGSYMGTSRLLAVQRLLGIDEAWAAKKGKSSFLFIPTWADFHGLKMLGMVLNNKTQLGIQQVVNDCFTGVGQLSSWKELREKVIPSARAEVSCQSSKN